MAASAVAMAILPVLPSNADEPGPAEPVVIEGGAGLNWGVRSSFRNYAGQAELADGATWTASGSIAWPVDAGTYDPATKALDVRFDGEARWLSHCGADGVCSLDFTLRTPRIVVSPTEATLYADVVSRDLDSGSLVDYPNVAFATLDVADATPQVDDTTTTWSALPANLTEDGYPSFAGFYPIGAELDAVTFGYEGPGGKPEGAEDSWTPAGTPFLERTATVALDAGSIALDPARDLAYVGQAWYPDHLATLEASTLDVVAGRSESPTLPASSTNPAPVLGDDGWVYVVPNDQPPVAVRWNGTGYDTTTLPGTLKSGQVRLAAWDASRSRLVGLSTSGEVRVWEQDEGEWTTRAHNVTGIVNSSMPVTMLVDGAGQLLLAQSSVLHRVVIGATSANSEPLLSGDLPASAEGRQFQHVVAGLVEGQVRLVANDGAVLTLERQGDDTYAAVGEVLAAGASFVRGVAVDAINGALYIVDATAGYVIVVHGGAIGRERIGGLPASVYSPLGLAADDGQLLVGVNDGGPALHRYVLAGASPAITAHPTSVTVDAGSDGPVEVRFEAAAVGAPDPTLQWQVRAPGAARWTDVGAPGSTLVFEAVGADDGRQFRVVASNAGGAIASESATLSVHHAPGVIAPPEDLQVQPGEAALFKVMPSGNPYPTITWQRQVGAGWVDLDADDPAYVIDGGFLTVLAPTEADSGARFRAKLTNQVDTTLSVAATLTVGTAGGPGGGDQQIVVEVPDLGPGELVWSIAGSAPVLLGEGVDAGDHRAYLGEIHPVQVTDTRVGNPAWSVSGQVGDFDAGVSGRYLGWRPAVVTPGAGAVAGSVVASGLGGGDGLRVPATLASAPDGHARGGATVGAELDLRLPVDVAPGTYSATLTITGLG